MTTVTHNMKEVADHRNDVNDEAIPKEIKNSLHLPASIEQSQEVSEPQILCRSNCSRRPPLRFREEQI